MHSFVLRRSGAVRWWLQAKDLSLVVPYCTVVNVSKLCQRPCNIWICQQYMMDGMMECDFVEAQEKTRIAMHAKCHEHLSRRGGLL